MEKRLFLSIILSFLVLYIWSVLNPPVKKNPYTSESLQVFENKEDIKYSPPSSPAALTSTPKQEITDVLNVTSAPDNDNKEETKSLESSKLLAELSNIGGNLSDVTIKEFDHRLPLTNILNISGYEEAPFDIAKSNEKSVVYSYQDQSFKVDKSYVLSEDDYLIISEINVTNVSEMSKLISLNMDSLYIDSSRLDNSNNQRYNMLLEYSVSYNGFIDRKRNASKFSGKETKTAGEKINWIGFRDQYFCAIVQPQFDSKEYYINSLDEKVLKLGVNSGDVRIDPGRTASFKSVIYYGPQDIKTLKAYDAKFEKIIDYKIGGFFDIMAFGLTDNIAKIMLVLLNFVHKILPNWGVCIIVFATMIYSLTYPLTRKSMVAMKKMQEIQPQVVKLREQHKNNPQKLNVELMELYKKHKANPLGGCLPIFFQMPIFISLYQLLWRTYSFKGADFLWIKDLAEPDRLFILPFKLPFFGNELNILPILYAILMAAQQKFTMKNIEGMDPQQAEMQKMMSKMMPILLGVVFYKFASGLTLYFTIYFLLTTVTQWKMNRPAKVA